MDLPYFGNRFQLRELANQNSLSVLEKDVREGLLSTPRSLPPKYFYDEYGSKLFEAICNTEDYYPTRAEHSLLKKHGEEIINIIQPKACIELGAGVSTKTELIISKLCEGTKESLYITIDVCKEVLIQSAQRLLENHLTLCVESIVGEYIPALQALPQINSPALYIFIGSSIGNFSHAEAVELLTQVADKMQAGDYFLLGMDRVKDKEVLERAYDDSDGITAKFNLNVLNVLNANLGTKFNLDQFSHQAVYNSKDQQIEMYLISKQNQEITFPTINKTIHLQEDEKILTEISRKYTKSSIQKLLTESGLVEHKHFQPDNNYFSLVMAKRG